MARPSKSEAIERLRKMLNELPELKQLRYDSPKFKKWKRDTQVALRNTFGDNSGQLKEFDKISFTPGRRRGIVSKLSSDLKSIDFTPAPDPTYAYVKGLEAATSLLESMIEEIAQYGEDTNQTQIPSGDQANGRQNSNKIFVIHGRDDGAKQTVARFLEKLSLKPVILHEQPSEGRTIIEKFEAHSDVGFAVALLTPDDTGSLQDGDNNLKPRARQNVIFELGFFIGRLGREGVCALTKGEVEIPSDYAGVVYIPLDDTAGWKQTLFQELDAAGFQLDANQAFRA